MKQHVGFLLIVILVCLSGRGYAADSYRVTSAGGAYEYEGIYDYYCEVITNPSHDEGQYNDIPMPVYRLPESSYFIGYRGCFNKWVILEVENNYIDGQGCPTPEGIGQRSGSGYHFTYYIDTPLPPRSGWKNGSHNGESPPSPPEVIPVYYLTTQVDGTGCSISRLPTDARYDDGTSVILTAQAAEGWAFSGWSGDLSGSANPTTITMDANKSVTATFEQLPQYTLTIHTTGSGGITLNPPGGTYDSGTTVTVTAEPSTNWSFSAWSGDLSGSANPTTITMDANRSIAATFTEMADYNVSVTAIGSGSITLDPPGGTYYEGTSVTMTAIPLNAYWHFSGWGGDLTGTANPATIIADADKVITAAFVEMDQYDLSVDTVGSGSVTLDPTGGTYYQGTTVTVTAVPADAHWQFSGWSGDLSGSANPGTIDMDAAKAVSATFTLVDSDGDGVPDQDEDAAPNSGDGNNDGTPDRLQNNVACVSAANQRYQVTLESANGTSLTHVQASSNPHPEDCPNWAEFPYGFFQFTITGIPQGEATTLTMYLPDDPNVKDPNAYYKYGPIPADPADQWYRFIYETATQLGAQFNGRTVVLHLIDGQLGDDDLAADGTIEDVGGPGIYTGSDDDGGSGPSPSTGGGGGGGGCFFSSLF